MDVFTSLLQNGGKPYDTRLAEHSILKWEVCQWNCAGAVENWIVSGWATLMAPITAFDGYT